MISLASLTTPSRWSLVISLRIRLACARAAAKVAPEWGRVWLATVWVSLAEHLAFHQRREEAALAARTAVRRWLLLHQHRPDRHQARLAHALGVLADRLGDIGADDEALAAAERAVELVQDHPAADAVVLATTRHALALAYARAGRPDDAMTTIEEAVALLRPAEVHGTRAVRLRPSSRPALAAVLTRFGEFLAGRGRYEEALAAYGEAVVTYQWLFRRGRWRYTVPYLGAQGQRARQLGALGRYADALEQVARPLAYFQLMAGAYPAQYRCVQAALLADVAEWRGALGQHDEALDGADLAVALFRHECETQPARAEAGLAFALRCLAVQLRALNRPAEAVVVLEEALVIRRRLAVNSSGHLAPLANLLTELADTFWALNKRGPAIRLTAERVAVDRQLVVDPRTGPEEGSRMLARDLYLLGVRRRAMGQLEDASQELEEAVDRLRDLVAGLVSGVEITGGSEPGEGPARRSGMAATAANPDDQALLADGLEELAHVYDARGYLVEAFIAIDESTAIRDRLVFAPRS